MEVFRDIIEFINPIIVVIYIISILFVAVFTVLENRNPLKTISWVLVLIFLPVIGFIFFVFFGQNFRKEKIIARKSVREMDRLSKVARAQNDHLADGEMFTHPTPEEERHVIQLLLHSSYAVVTIGDNTDVQGRGPASFASSIQGIESAEHFRHREY